ncbi:MAG: EF-P lysine aminoacylase GenX [Cellvibrionales bacterium]|nr:EF-P lysine aminoacylase GenX [Cellvibrionales bacterium]
MAEDLPLDSICRRADLYRQLRAYFAAQGVLEVEVPLLGRAGGTDLQIALMEVVAAGGDERLYLQPSPELFMKRLLAAGSGPIFYLGKCFRGGEQGGRHNPEFSMLEWYRPGFCLERLMADVAALMQRLVPGLAMASRPYAELFAEHCGVDPHRCSDAELDALVAERTRYRGQLNRDAALSLLFAELVEPHLGAGGFFVVDYPAGQAAMAQLVERDGVAVAERFEFYLEGVELANGYLELTDAAEQRARFQADNRERRARGLAEMPVDEKFLAALEAGLPACAGVALGVDRLLGLLREGGAADIADDLLFAWDRL